MEEIGCRAYKKALMMKLQGIPSDKFVSAECAYCSYFEVKEGSYKEFDDLKEMKMCYECTKLHYTTSWTYVKNVI